MATTAGPAHAHDRTSRRRPFSAFMKRLANLKSSSSDSTSHGASTKLTAVPKAKKTIADKNNPYPSSGQLWSANNVSGNSVTETGESSGFSSRDGPCRHEGGTISKAPTLATNPETVVSDTTQSAHAGSSGGVTSATAGGAMSAQGGAGSTFSSPAPSIRSLTTTLTTIQSINVPAAVIAPVQGQAAAANADAGSTQQNTNQTSHFSHQFPTSPPPSAIPSHLTPQVPTGGNPTTYSSATANNLLTDNASILTLASSSKRRRRRSVDTDASVRALAPSSLWGGSRESLPLSVLSSNIDSGPTSAGMHQGRPSVSGIPAGERASVYSTSGIAPALTSERSSYYAGKTVARGEDGASTHSGFLGHSRNDSVPNSVGVANSPLASPREANVKEAPSGRMSRRSSGWGDVGEEDDETDVTEIKGKGNSKEKDAGTGKEKGKEM